MNKLYRIIAILMLLLITISGEINGQVFEIKKWTGTYPDMEGTYPLTFISFKGKIIPIPHVFVKAWPTHYYVEVGAIPVLDSPEIAGKTITGLLRIASKMLERYQMKGRHDETNQIKNNTDFQKQIEEKLFNARTEQLQDLYGLAKGFIQLYKKVDKLGHLPNSVEVKRIFQKESDQLLMRFLMVNLFNSEHGDKLEAFSEISSTLNNLQGEVDYTFSKIHFFSNYNEQSISYSFLTQ